MRKQFLSWGLCLAMVVLMMTGCGTKEKPKTDAAPEVETQESEPEESKQEESEPEESESEESKEAGQMEPVEGLSDKFVDFDNRSFAANGKVYTLGANTLQEMIDDGVPFEEGDLADANNNLKPNSQSPGFKIVLGEYYSAQVFVSNFTEENATTADCVISEVYLPVDQDKQQDILQFAFPLTITEEELIAQSGEPSDRNDYKDGEYESHTLKYQQKSEKYIGDSGYTFEFTNGVLKYITIDLK